MANIRLSVIPLFILFISFSGCTSSDEALDDEYVTDTQSADTTSFTDTAAADIPAESEPPLSAAQQRFNVQADTVTVQSRKKEKASPSPVSVKTAVVQKKYYSVQIGAFRLKSNTDRNYRLTQQRFRQPVVKFFEAGIKMDRICIGHFMSLKEAAVFLRSIQKQYPNDYKDAWIARINK